MHYYTHNIGEFATQTRFLSPEEIGIYVILKDEYFASGMRLACDRIANVMPPQCEASLKRVLQRFFREEDGFFVCDTFEKELESYKGKGEKNRENAKKRWEKKRIECESNASECESQEIASDCDANQCLTNNHKPITNNQEVIKKTRQKKVVEKPDEVTEQVWDDFCEIRKEKKAPLTKTALDLIKAEAEKAGIGLNEALSISCSRGWQSFKAEWMRGSQTRNDGFGAPSIEQPRPKSYEPDWDKIDYGETRPLSEC